MIYTYLEGRLGNCLFEIAAGASLAKKMGAPYRALTCNPDIQSKTDSRLLVDYLKPFQKTILRKVDFLDSYPEDVAEYKEIGFSYDALPLQDHLILKGILQSEKYFDKELVRSLFEIDPETKAYICKKYGHILQLNPVSIHVRRGDYLSLEYMLPVCRMSYFKKAIACFEPGTSFLVMSDDLAWCKKHFKGGRFYYADNESPLVDLYLQSMCAHNIISNSTFSWWGAWLNPNITKKVIFPNPWFGCYFKKKKEYDTKDLCPESWIPISLGKFSYYFYGAYSFLKMGIEMYNKRVLSLIKRKLKWSKNTIAFTKL